MPPTTLGSDPLGWAPPLPLPRKRRHLWPVALVVLAALAVASVFVSLPYEVVSPGGANDLSGLVSIKGTSEFRAKGAVLFVTVGVRDNVSPLQLLAAWVSPDRDFYRLPKSYSHKQEQVINTTLMSDSKLLAEGVAISRAGPNAPKATGAEVSVVVPDRPAAAFLKVHDVIVAIDGRKVTATECAVGGIRAHKPGDKISVTFIRDGKQQTAEATLAAGPQNTPLLGVQLETKFATGFAVDINSGLVTGPSAGLAYALELLDLMTPGELTGGARVAATGELDTDGSGKVLPIGGEAEKAATVRSQHVAMFIVPRANYAKAKAHAGKLQVVPVDTIDDALRALATLPGSNAGQYLQAASPC